MLSEFKKFIARGNVVDLAVGVIIGAAFGKIVTSLVNDMVMPPIGLLLGKVNFNNLFVALGGRHFDTLAEAKAAGAATVNYGAFLNTVIEFLIIAFVVFLIVRAVQRFHPEPAKPSPRKCTYCFEPVATEATRCSHCTSQLAESRATL